MIKTPREARETKLFHANLLKQWKESSEECIATVLSVEEGELPCPRLEDQAIEDATFGAQLSSQQRNEIK